MVKKKIFGNCRVCNEVRQLSEEHYIPRSAGGGLKTKLYSGDELLKTLHNDSDGKSYIPYGKIKQSGISDFTLCKKCNEESGVLYDKDFANFYHGINNELLSQIEIPEGSVVEDYLVGKKATLDLIDIKPFNIAKRILVSFCSVEHAGMTQRRPEIKKAIKDKNYHPNTDDFSLFFSLHLGNSAFYGTVAVMKEINDQFVSQSYAGIESDLLAFYYSTDSRMKNAGLENCTDITSWLTDYNYDEVDTITLDLTFNKSLNIRFPLGNKI